MIYYQDNLLNIALEQLIGFFADWRHKPDQDKHYQMLQNSSFIELAWEDQNRQVVGFINAVSDQIFSVYIPLLEVLPEYRNRGIGSTLVRRLMLKLKNFYMIDLICDENMITFYEKLGFTITRGMSIRNYHKIRSIYE